MSHKLVIVIPSYEPNHQLVDLIHKLNNFFNDFNIIVVNDGSTNHDDIFNEVKSLDNVILLNHEINKGKGEALKTAFRFIKEKKLKSIIVTADSDGQHTPEDIKRVYDFYLNHEKSLVLGSRKFENNVPLRSSFGNDVSRGLMRLCVNKHLNDTQTGLRAFDYSLIDFMLSVKGSRFEYEINMLSEAVRKDIEINEIAIQTIYIDNNKGSHFRPVRDFSKISIHILKYILPGVITLLFDFLLFMTLILANKNINIYILICFSTLSSTASVLINLIINFTGILYGNKKIFKKKSRWIKYIILALINIGFSLGVLVLFNLCMKEYILIRLFSSLMLILIYALFNYFVLKKSKLFEE